MLGHTGVPSAAELQGSAEPTLKTKAGVVFFVFVFVFSSDWPGEQLCPGILDQGSLGASSLACSLHGRGMEAQRGCWLA